MKKTGCLLAVGAALSLILTSCGAQQEHDYQPIESSENQVETMESIVLEITDNVETTEENNTLVSTDATEEKIENQTFDVELRPLGRVIFGSYAPDTSENPLADVVFRIEKDGEVIQTLSGVSEDNCRADQYFQQVEAVSFPDYNEDGCDDIVVICSYFFASGADAGQEDSEVRFYKGSQSGSFSYEKQMSEDASSALAEVTIQSALDFIGAVSSK